ncbi:phosphate ABC transporter permease PstA [Pseudomonas citronellolis]|uniref:phosphate ABC transporter permease PstA n=1 Tax=Pseudomonas citronellolis TaxID=53408 RepID=UPI00209F87C0|nr:phosphate ABC transporter permease PstA [Pseudomonas citronellolis]MCP1644836.1 phosphate transport system permease protein [Pseudomonas citronellolis]MCP1664975.1 phosphate transport system permease protein [Pseudomonas citronellolis]MCP1698990.1 phosphate transport system permease protein [Pseudomonas citronellolis]MCP1705650.1 phosphate transport system permease protein [Pseudomonas citronellolis]MCP1799409.1 phosphate transport system permease protein [Pseudomonas citronellolis]
MKQKQETLKAWFASGSPWVWMNAGAVSIAVIMTLGLLAVIAVRGLGHFWPADVLEARYSVPGQEAKVLIGEEVQVEEVPRERLRGAGLPVPAEGPEFMTRELLKLGNRDLYGSDFSWVIGDWLAERRWPQELVTLERREWGNFYGYLVSVKQDGQAVAQGAAAMPELQERLRRVDGLYDQLYQLEKKDIGSINHELERLRLKERRLQLHGGLDATAQADLAAARAELQGRYREYEGRLGELRQQFNRDSVVMRDAGGRELEISLGKLVHAYQPNAMGFGAKLSFYFKKLWEFLSEDPREANTEGGIFPAIFGTVMMTLVMAVIVTPFGVIAAVYLREYARQGLLTRVIRIAVNNLAGVPAIVYGVFGLGFFVYVLGGSIDRLFFPEALPAPTFGTPGLFWASLTLAILAVPVVIVATEEGLSRIPRAIREGSLALGATKAETLWKIVLPMASPAMMTGLILAVARAAGEVAPLMLVGVVKLAPSLPVDGNYPYVHLDQKIMHLGFHIYDVGFQSPNVEAARPLVYATALLLVLVIALLNFSAIAIRNRLREKYKALEN